MQPPAISQRMTVGASSAAAASYQLSSSVATSYQRFIGT